MSTVFSLLLVEDNPADIIITRRALNQSQHPLRVTIVRDGQQALDYLLQQGDYQDDENWQMPSLVLLDINLPRVSGLQLVELVRKTEHLQMLPIVVYTTSTRIQDIHDLYRAGANSYFTKPNSFAELVEKIQAVLDYWLGVVRLP